MAQAAQGGGGVTVPGGVPEPCGCGTEDMAGVSGSLSQDLGAMSQQLLYRALVSAKWLSEAIKSKQTGQALKVVDASWYLPKMKCDSK